jgi:hypothetical protein
MVLIVVVPAVTGDDTAVAGFDGASGFAFSSADMSCLEYVQPQMSTSTPNIHICTFPISPKIHSSLAWA